MTVLPTTCGWLLAIFLLLGCEGDMEYDDCLALCGNLVASYDDVSRVCVCSVDPAEWEAAS